MELRKIDYYTIAGLAIFVILSVIYLCLDDIKKIHLSLSPPEMSYNGGSLPPLRIPDFNLDWFHSMDPVSRILFCFLAMVVVSTAIGCAWLYMRYRRSRAG
jgi:hypothetical protein